MSIKSKFILQLFKIYSLKFSKIILIRCSKSGITLFCYSRIYIAVPFSIINFLAIVRHTISNSTTLLRVPY